MISAQQKIIIRAPRMLLYYAADGRKGIIPDTEKARKWAVRTHRANQFSRYTYHYFGPDGSGSDYLVGDFYCLVSSTKKYCLENGAAVGPDKFITADTALRTQQLLRFSFNVDQVNCKCIYLGEPTFGIFIPSSAFGIERGAFFLNDLYEEVFLRLSMYGPRFELQVSRSHRVPIENTPLPRGKFAIPFFIDEFSRLPKPLDELASSPRVAPNGNFAWTVNRLLLAHIQGLAVARSKRHHDRKKAWWSRHPDQEYLVNLERVPFCSPSNLRSAQTCAQKLIRRITLDNLMEFSQRDAERVTGKHLHGAIGEGGGVADALQILVCGHYILECSLPRIDYPCGRPAPWFLVNPMLFASPLEPADKVRPV